MLQHVQNMVDHWRAIFVLSLPRREPVAVPINRFSGNIAVDRSCRQNLQRNRVPRSSEDRLQPALVMLQVHLSRTPCISRT